MKNNFFLILKNKIFIIYFFLITAYLFINDQSLYQRYFGVLKSEMNYFQSAEVNLIYKFFFIFFIIVIAFLLKKYLFYALLFNLFFFYSLIFGIEPFVFLVIFLVSSVLMGSFIINFFFHKTNICNFENLVLGFCIYGLLINFLSYFPINNYIVYLSILILPLLIKSKKNFFLLKLEILKFHELLTKNNKINLIFIFFIISICFFIYIVTVSPDFGHDSRCCHLTIPFKIKEYGLWKYNIYDYIWAVIPMGAHWIYSLLNMFSGEPGLRLLNMSFFVLNIFLVFSFVKKQSSFNYGLLASLMFASLPLSINLLSTTQPETFLCLVLTVILSKCFDDRINFPVLFIFLGYAVNVKFTSILLVPFFGLLIIYNYIGNQIKFKTVLLSALLFLLFSAPPYVTAYMQTGSPTFPLFNEIFKSDLISKSAFYHPAFADASILDLITLSFNTEKYGAIKGAIGTFFIFIIPALLFSFFNFSKKIIFFLLAAFFYIFTIWYFQAYLRYVYPILVWIVCLVFIGFYDVKKNYNFFNINFYFIIFINIILLPNSFHPAPSIYHYFNKSLNDSLWNVVPDIELGKMSFEHPLLKNKKILKLVGPVNYADFQGTLVGISWHSKLFWEDSIYMHNNIYKILAKNNIDIVIISKDFKITEPFKYFEKIRNFTEPLFEYKDFEIRKFTR